MYDIYTPKGTPVVTFQTYESSSSVRQAFDNYYATYWPQATQIKTYNNYSSTRRFNCHGYAWLMVEGGLARWIGYKEICINDGELIVGERGPGPKLTPTYPEICLHSLKDLEILDLREKVFFRVSDEVKKVYEKEIIPYWNGRSNRDKIMALMGPEWHNAYNAGVFTEFQEQRAPGHTVLGYKMFSTGFNDLRKEIREAADNVDSALADASARLEELKAMDIACEAIIMYAGRHAEALEILAEKEEDTTRKNELLGMAAICRKVPANAPETVHEMLQHYWFIHLGVITELNP